MIDHAEGSWDEVMGIIGQAHEMLHKQGVVRISTDIRVGSRFARFSLFPCYSSPGLTWTGRTRCKRQRIRWRL